MRYLMRLGALRLGLALGCLLAVGAIASAPGERRIALLIGNQAYTGEIARLANPHTDVALLEKALKQLNFEVQVVHDAGLGQLQTAINAYVRRVRTAGPGAVAFLYYAGHGASDSSGVNYLIPVDARSADDGELWDQSLRLEGITRQLKADAPDATHLVVFDACRNELRLKSAGTRSLLQTRGLKTVTAEAGMLIAFATAEGQLAADGAHGGGPYAKALAEELVRPGVEAVTMFRNVQLRVKAAIGQEPWLGFNAFRQVHLASPRWSTPEAGPAPPSSLPSSTLPPQVNSPPPSVPPLPPVSDPVVLFDSTALPSFSCREYGSLPLSHPDRNPRSDVYCIEPELARVDYDLGIAFRARIARLTGTARRNEIDIQKQWIRDRDRRCPATWDDVRRPERRSQVAYCLKRETVARIEQLRR